MSELGESLRKLGPKPRLMPLVRRWGWAVGIATWRLCRQRGHDWKAVESYTQMEAYRAGGVVVWVGLSKLRCECCQTARLIHLTVFRHMDGSICAVSPDLG
jgi:hypothetical protein